MALSNTTHGAPGKAHGAGRGAPVTGIEFLTGEGGDAAGIPGKDGVDFSALMQGIIQPALTPEAAKAADALPVPSVVLEKPETSAQQPDDAVALLAVALHNGGSNAPVVAQPGVSPILNGQSAIAPKDKGEAKAGEQTPPAVLIAPLGGKAATRRAAAALAEGKAAPVTSEEDSGGKRETKENGTAPLAEAAPAPIAIAPVTQAATAIIAQAQAQAQAEAVGNASQPVPAGASGDRRRGEGRGKAEGVTAAMSVPLNSQNRVQPQADPAKGDAKAPLQSVEGTDPGRIVASIITDTEYKKNTANNYNAKENIRVFVAESAAPELIANPASLAEPREDEPPAPRIDGAQSTPRTDAAGQPLPQSVPVSFTPAVGAPSIANSLGQQVVDMGVSGQWINDIARQIASISANPGHGSFRIESAELGAVRVDIAPASVGGGSDILMRVDSDAAFAALNDDKERLMQDARMASVRIGELRIDRVAPGQEAARGDMGGNSQQQQNPTTQQQGSQQSLSQNGAQMGDRGGQQQGRPDAAALAGQNQGGQNPKAPFTTTVMRGADADEATGPMRSGRGDSARYA